MKLSFSFVCYWIFGSLLSMVSLPDERIGRKDPGEKAPSKADGGICLKTEIIARGYANAEHK